MNEPINISLECHNQMGPEVSIEIILVNEQWLIIGSITIEFFKQ